MTPASPRPQVDAAVERILCSDLPLLHLFPSLSCPPLTLRWDTISFKETAFKELE